MVATCEKCGASHQPSCCRRVVGVYFLFIVLVLVWGATMVSIHTIKKRFSPDTASQRGNDTAAVSPLHGVDQTSGNDTGAKLGKNDTAAKNHAESVKGE